MLTQTFPHEFCTYHSLQLDAYLLHLADCESTLGVVASEDILSAEGKLLVAKDTAITPSLAHTFSQLTLLKPLELSVSLERELDVFLLEADFMAVMQQDDFLLAINDSHNLNLPLKTLCQYSIQYSILRQKLTVMQKVLPELYQRSLYCAWLSFLVAKEMRLTEQDIALTFVAALYRDIGMLHVDPDIINRKATLTFNECLQLQMHVVVGSQIISAVPSMPVAVSRAVYEHHERCDGTGYPHGKVESELGISGLIIGLADSVVAIYYHRFKELGGSWRDVVPIIQMNAQAYFYRNYEVLTTVFRRGDLPLRNVVQGDETAQFIAGLADNNKRLKNWFEAMRDCYLSIGYRHGDRRLYSLQNVMLHVSTSVEGSGIFNKQLLELPDGGDKKAAEEMRQKIESAHLMQQEIVFHLQRLSRMTHLYLESGDCKKDDVKSILLDGLTKAKKFLM